MKRKKRQILSLSGGKDSAALAVYLRDRVPDIEYVFCDTGKELDETYEYLGRLQAYLGKEITTLRDEYSFDHYLVIYANFLPSPLMRWCTKHLKLQPFERYVGDTEIVNYIGIRADENRDGYISHKQNITARYPFKEDGLVKADVIRILNEAGLGLPKYYNWRSRSGCFFCFFQQKIEWIGLYENHKPLFEEAQAYEKIDLANNISYTWTERESLADMIEPERIAEIKADHEKRVVREAERNKNELLYDRFGSVAPPGGEETSGRECENLNYFLNMSDDDLACQICK